MAQNEPQRKRRRQALHQTHHHYYLNVSVQAANLSDWRIESNRNFFLPELECSTIRFMIGHLARNLERRIFN